MSGHDQISHKNVIDFKRSFPCMELKFRTLACKLNNHFGYRLEHFTQSLIIYSAL